MTETTDRYTAVAGYDGEPKAIRVLEGQIFACTVCCCGCVDRGNPAVPLERFKSEWKGRGIRKRVHLTITGCLGRCTASNEVLFTYMGATVWFQSINSDGDVVETENYIERLLADSRFDLLDGPLASEVFERFTTDEVCNFKGDSEQCSQY